METIYMTETRYIKNPNTKTAYIQEEKEMQRISRIDYSRITGEDTLKWFRRLGGTETAQRSYTCRGYLITKLTSTSPDKQTKIIREFNFS